LSYQGGGDQTGSAREIERGGRGGEGEKMGSMNDTEGENAFSSQTRPRNDDVQKKGRQGTMFSTVVRQNRDGGGGRTDARYVGRHSKGPEFG